MARFKVDQQPAFLLHRRPYSETSLLLDFFTRDHGRLTLIGKGCRKKKNQPSGLFQELRPLLVSWSGKGELPILSNIEPNGHVKNPDTDMAWCGYYLNELLLKLLHRHDSHENLFDRYQDTVLGLLMGNDPASELRVFEKHLLGEIGFGLVLDHDVDTGEVIDDKAEYFYYPDKGPVLSESGSGNTVSGMTLNALQNESFATKKERNEARKLTRQLIDLQLNGKQLRSRRVIRELTAYESKLA